MKSKIISKFLALLCLLTISINQTFADDIKVLSDYLKSLKSVSIDFTQYDARSGRANGKLVIMKPDYFRCNYYAPYPLLIVGNKKEVAMYDYELEHVTHIDKKENLFNFLLTDASDWEKDFVLEEVINESDRRTYKLYHDISERLIYVTIKKFPKRILAITIDEADGNVIEVNFGDIQEIKSAKKGFFTIRNPEMFGPPKRLDAKEIEKWVE